MGDQTSFGFTKDTEAIARRPSFANSLNDVIKQQSGNPRKRGNGFLLKKSSAGHFNKRWVVVHGHYLSYFKADPSSTSPANRVPLGALDLWHVEGVSLDDCTISLRLSPHALQARLEEMGGETAKRLLAVASGPIARGMAKRLDNARRGAFTNQNFVLKAPSTREAQAWLSIMRESPLMGSLAGLHKALAEEGEMTIKEFRINMPPKREFIFADVSSVFEGATDILLRNVPITGSTVTVVLVSGENHDSEIEAVAPFEPRLESESGEVTISFPAKLAVRMAWTRKFPSRARQASFGAAVFGIVTVFSLIYSRMLYPSMIMGAICSFGTIYLLVKQEAIVNNVVIRAIMIEKSGVASPPGSPHGGLRKALSKYAAYVPTDPHITLEEGAMIAELRERVQDMWSVPADAATFLKKHEKFLKEWHADLNAIKNPQKIKTVMDKHILEDFRIVRFIRARKHKIDKAEHMLRDSLLWRVALGSDEIHSDQDLGMPPEWVCRYFGSKDILTMIRPVQDSDTRLKKFFVRDKEGHLGLFFRSGRLNTRKIFKKLASKPCYMIKLVVWTTELLRHDLERHRELNPGKPETVLSVIVDLDGFAISEQLPLGDLIPLARRFFPIFATSYPELLNRVLVFNAPWLFGSLWTAIKPFIPEEVQEKIQIHSGAINYEKHIKPYFADEYVPKYFGGNMTDAGDGNEFCLDRVAPYGPYGLPNEGYELLEGTDAKAETW